MLENEKFEGIHYSRFIASWANVAGDAPYAIDEWLETITVNGKPLPEEVIRKICDMAWTGKLELETSARLFVKKLKEQG